jgi:hypothetical protein
MNESHGSSRKLLRHTLATLAYRGGKAIRDVPAGLPDFAAFTGTRTPRAILAHVGDLLDWAVELAQGRHVWKDAVQGDWQAEVERFYAGLHRLDELLASDVPLGFSEEELFQGPIADALTHVGQIAMLRRMCGGPVRGENYFKAKIQAGRVGRDQAAPVFEFE